MYRLLLLSAMAICFAAPLRAAEKAPPVSGVLVDRIDSLIATRNGRRVIIQAKGAVKSGGWKKARLKPDHSVPADPKTITVDFVANPPAPDEAVIPGLVPVSASVTLRMPRGAVSVHAVAGTNDVITQILQ